MCEGARTDGSLVETSSCRTLGDVVVFNCISQDTVSPACTRRGKQEIPLGWIAAESMPAESEAPSAESDALVESPPETRFLLIPVTVLPGIQIFFGLVPLAVAATIVTEAVEPPPLTFTTAELVKPA